MFILDAAVSNGEVIGMGLGVVFVGLICIIVLIKLTSLVIGAIEKKKPAQQESASPAKAAAVPVSGNEIPNRPQFVAAVSAAIAEDLGTDITKIQIVSIKKL